MNLFYQSYILFLLLSLASITEGYSQTRENNPVGRNSIGTSGLIDTTDSGILPLDTPVARAYVFHFDPDQVHVIPDSFNWEDNRHHALQFYQAHLGNIGSAYRNLTAVRKIYPGFSTGWDQYDAYYVPADSFRYYHQAVPVLSAQYSQTGPENTYLNLDFGRKFARGLSLSLVYKRINQEGIFAHQAQRNSTFGIGVWNDTDDERYDAFYSIISDGAVGEENGGIADPSQINDSILRQLVPVYRLNAATSHKHRTFYTKQIFHLLSDSTQLGIDVWMQAHYNTSLYKFTDPDTIGARQFYGDQFFVDARGLRQYTFKKESQVSAGIALPWKAARSKIQSSLRYRRTSLDQEPVERKINELYWDASGEFQWIEPIKLRGSVSLGLGTAKGTFGFQADGALNTGLFGLLESYYSLVTRHPYTIESRLYMNQLIVYNKSFENLVTHQFGVSWNWKKQLLRAGMNWYVYDNFIYFNETKLPIQLSESFSLRQFFAEKTFDFKWIGIKGNFIWQPDTKRELAMPDLLYAASLYGRTKIFKKKLEVMPGIDITYHDGFAGTGYFPATGRFYLTGGPDIPDYFRLDAAIGIHVNFLQIFVRMEDLVGLWKERALYQTDYYAHFPGYFRIGISAGFFN
ncbi:MAG: putative porin [Bacteroidota bacterium]|nr:putative porin [Bacteroidota bacterium]